MDPRGRYDRTSENYIRRVLVTKFCQSDEIKRDEIGGCKVGLSYGEEKLIQNADGKTRRMDIIGKTYISVRKYY